MYRYINVYVIKCVLEFLFQHVECAVWTYCEIFIMMSSQMLFMAMCRYKLTLIII